MNVFGIPLGKGKYQRLISFIWKFAAFGFGSFIIYLVAVNFNLFWVFGQMPNIEDLDNPKSEIASEIISSDGKVIGKYFFQNRTPVDFDDLPASLIDALISTEDVRFTRHAGIDARSMLRVIGGILTFDRKGGGSTISQQLAKNLFRLRQDEKYTGPVYKVPGLRTLVIKTKEWITALKLERIYTKQEIMKLYLDTIEFSSGAYGIKAAAKTYFNKPVTNLTVNESALLVGMIQNPSRFNPNLRPQNATGRRNIVLSQMVKYGKIESAKLEAYQKEPIVLDYNPASHNSGLAPYFREFLKDWAKAEIEKLGYEPEDLYTKGFKIYTTIDSRMQRYAEEAVAEHMTDQQKKFDEHWKGQNPWVQRASENSSRYVEIPGFIERMASRTGYYQSLKRKYGNDKEKIMAGMNVKMDMRVFTWKGERDTLMSHMDSIRHYKRFLNIGMMAMDPRDGNIKAWVGGINYKYFKYDHVAQSKRQPGSTFKPFVYVTAIDNGFSTCERVNDSPVTFGPEDGVPGSWTPKNSNGKYSYQDLTLRQALGQSVNTVSAKLIKRFTPGMVVNYAHMLGIKSELPAVPTLCLGVGEVSLFEMLGGYGTFVNGGKYTEPMFVLRIEDKYGEVLREYIPDQKEVLSTETAYKMVHLMRGATQPGGTSVGLGRYGILSDNEVAGKTGTTSNFSDGWFMGMTQSLIGGVWAGGDDRAIHFRSITLGQGARMAMPAWGLFMQKVYADKDIDYKKTKFKIPATIRISGDCATSAGEITSLGPPDSTANYQPPTVKPANEDELL
jgi:penicillin-binding protein 1A